MIVLVLYLLLALGVSFLCSILEASLLSMTPSFVRQRERAGGKVGEILGRLKRDIDEPLAAILTLNTIAHTVGAAGVGSTAVALFGEAYFGIISAMLTLLILVASEIIPKTLGAQHWRSLAGFTAYACRVIVVATYPLVQLSKRLTGLLQRKGPPEKSVSREELVALAQIGQSEGTLRANETRMIRSLIRFREVRVENIMTPRTVMGAVPQDMTCRDAVGQSHLMRFSRIPVFSGDNDNIVGYALKSDLLTEIVDGRPDTPVEQIARPIRVVTQMDTLSRLFDELVRHNEQIAVVVDEYGGTSGVVTMEDVIETLLGLEIVDELDRETDMRELARERWRERARRSGLVEADASRPPEPR